MILLVSLNVLFKYLKIPFLVILYLIPRLLPALLKHHYGAISNGCLVNGIKLNVSRKYFADHGNKSRYAGYLKKTSGSQENVPGSGMMNTTIYTFRWYVENIVTR